MKRFTRFATAEKAKHWRGGCIFAPICVTYLGFERMPFQYGAAFFCVDYQAVAKNMHKFENNTCAVLLRCTMFASWKSHKTPTQS